MPKKVSQLTLENRSNLTNAFQVLVMNPTNYELYRTPVTQFRGASVFTSTNAPTVTPEDPLIPSYIAGDIYLQDTPEGQKVYIWDNVNTRWDTGNKLNGLRLLTAVDFPSEISLDYRGSNFISDLVYENDYYLNKTVNILFGPYNPTTGFKFGSVDFNGYQGFRAPTIFPLQGKDVDGYDDIVKYISDSMMTLTPLDVRRYSLPIHQDGYHLKLENDEGHGGWIWYMDTTRPNGALPNNWISNLNSKLGADPSGVDRSNRYNFREAKTWNENSPPVQNNKKYRNGDNVFDTVNGVLYYNYNEDAPNNTSDLGVLFEGQTTLAGSSLKTSKDAGGNWIDPAANDSGYKQGDYIFTRSKGTPRIHGPYKFGAADDREAWPLFTVLRQPIKHINLAATTLPTTFDASGYPETTDNIMIVDGDTWEKVYIDDLVNANDETKRVVLSRGAEINYTTNTLTWGTETLNNRPPKFFRQDTIGQPVKDDNNYYEGDYTITSDGGVYGPYVESAADNPTAWPFFTSLKASKIVRALDQATDYTPDTANNSASWGGASVAEGDTLFVYYTGSTTGKYREYLATDVDSANGNTITWSEVGKAPVIHGSNLKTWPTVNDADYRTGDYIENASGIKFGPYVEGKLPAENMLAWPFSAVKRSPKRFYKNSFLFATQTMSTFLPATTSYFIDDTNWGTEHQNTILMVGDQFNFLSDSGKVVTFEVQTVDYVNGTHTILKVPSNSANTKIHNSTATSTPQRNDNIYSAGDFIINANGVMYGPYVEGQSTDVAAWPLKQSLRDNIGIIADTGSIDAGKNWRFVVQNGIVKIEEVV